MQSLQMSPAAPSAQPPHLICSFDSVWKVCLATHTYSCCTAVCVAAVCHTLHANTISQGACDLTLHGWVHPSTLLLPTLPATGHLASQRGATIQAVM